MKKINPLIQAYTQRKFQAGLIATCSRSQITEATRWAVEHNACGLMLAVRPHSKFKTKGGAHGLAKRAIASGSLDVLGVLRNELSAHTLAENEFDLLKEALCSSSLVGIRWLIKNRQAFGLNNDHFAQILRTHCLSAHPTVVDFLTHAFPQQHFAWPQMAEKSAVNNKPEQCVVFLRQCLPSSGRPHIYLPRHIWRVLDAAVQHFDPPSFSSVFKTVEQIYASNLTSVGYVPNLFKAAIERDQNPQGAIEALVAHFGAHVDCRSLGDECVNKIESYKSASLANTITGALGEELTSVAKFRKI